MGWVCAGGSLADARVLMLCLLLFIWQVPHFWLLLLDRGRELRQAGLPALTDLLPVDRIRTIVAVWILGTAACALLIALSGLVTAWATRCAVLGISLWLSYQAIRFPLRPAGASSRLFRTLNLYLLFVLLLLSLGRLPIVRESLSPHTGTPVSRVAADAGGK